MMPNYSFPVLKPHEVVSNVIDLGLCNISDSFTVEHLRHITPETASSLYDSFTRFFLNMEDDQTWEKEIHQPSFSGLEVLEDREFHVDSVRIVNVISKIRKVMHAAGVHDFSVRDIFKPDYQRTVRILSGLINFCRYRESKLEEISQPIVEHEELNALLDDLENMKFQLERKVAEIEAERQSRQPEIQALESEINELKQTICNLNKQQSNLQSELNKAKKKMDDYNEKISNAKYLLFQKKQDASQQRSLIVQSPEKIQKTLEEKRSLKEECECCVKELVKTLKRANAAFEAYSKAHKKLAKSSTLISNLREQINSGKSVEKTVKALKAKLKDAEKEDWSLETKRIEMQLQVEQLQKSIKNIESEKEIKCKEAENELEAVRSHISPRLQRLQELEKELSEKKAELEAIHTRFSDVKADKEVTLAKLLEKQMVLMKKGQEYSNRILKSLNKLK